MSCSYSQTGQSQFKREKLPVRRGNRMSSQSWCLYISQVFVSLSGFRRNCLYVRHRGGHPQVWLVNSLWAVGRYPWAGGGFSQVVLLSRMCSKLRGPFGKGENTGSLIKSPQTRMCLEGWRSLNQLVVCSVPTSSLCAAGFCTETGCALWQHGELKDKMGFRTSSMLIEKRSCISSLQTQER